MKTRRRVKKAAEHRANARAKQKRLRVRQQAIKHPRKVAAPKSE